MKPFILATKRNPNRVPVLNPDTLGLHKTYRDPHFCFHVNTNDQRVLDFLESYLAFRDTEKKYDPFFEITYRVHFTDSAVLDQHEKAAYSGAPLGQDEFLATVGERGAEVKLNIAKMEVDANVFCLRHDLGIMDFVFLQPCRTFLAFRDWLCTHGSYVQGYDRDIIFMGPSGSGKSSLGYALGMHEGYILQSDDEVFIHSGKQANYCLPFPTRIGFKNKAMEKRLTDAGGPTTIYGAKKRFSLPSSAANFGDSVGRKTLVLLPRYDDKATSLSVADANTEVLVQEAFNFVHDMCHLRHLERRIKEVFFTLFTFIKRCDVYKLTYNDRLLDQLPAFIETLL